MPRRNLTVILLVGVLSVACYARVDRGHYAAKLHQIINHIHDDGLYEIDRREVFVAAAKAMADAVNENTPVKNTAFYTQREREELEQELEQTFGGIGAVLETHKDRPRIRHVFYGNPAAKAGLRPGDTVMTVGGIDTLDFDDLRSFTDIVKGKPGEDVTLTVQREGVDEPLTFTITRAVIEIESVKGYIRRPDGSWDYRLPDHPDIAYMRIDRFGAKTYRELAEALNVVHVDGVEGLILDLRNDPGGLLDAAVDVCDLFLPASKTILTTRDRDKKVQRSFSTSGDGPYQKLPLAILINKRSASASEIVAGCLQDHGRAIVVGERSFGKGTVQQLFAVDGGLSTLKLTTASYWTPSERRIHRSSKHGGETREGADEDAEWGVLPTDGYEVVLDNDGIGDLIRHFEKLDFAAIDGADATPDREETPKLPPADQKPQGTPDESQDSDDGPADESAKPEDSGPVVDVQLRRAIEAIENLIDGESERRAA